jgi:isocitrate dehydrogenase (NAD+)
VLDTAERIADAVLAAVADEQDAAVAERAVQCAHRPRPSPGSPGARIRPGSQWAPWIAHGTMCSSRQNAAMRSPSGSVARKPSSRPMSMPHQLHFGPVAMGRGSLLMAAQGPAISCGAMADPLRIVVLEGDQTGQELLDQALRVLDPDLLELDLDLQRFDLSLESRRSSSNDVVHEAARAMRSAGYGLKAATITPEGRDDVGSPNRILREEVDGKVIIRTGRRIPGVTPVAGVHDPISVVRMAVDDAYGAEQWREGGEGSPDEVAYRTEKISRRLCRAVVEFAFAHARRSHAKVFGGPKYTVSPVYEGLLKEEMDAAAARYPDVRYEPRLIDATYALLLSASGEALVVPALNRDGDCLSDFVLQLFGSIAGAESLLLAFDDEFKARTVMAEAPHGTAPALYGKNVANPMAMILAGASLLTYLPDPGAAAAARAIYEAVFEAVADGLKTADLGGHATTTAFTDEVIRRVGSKLEVWATLGE